MTDTIRLDTLRLNDGSYGLPKNPRFIRDERFRALCRSIADNPEYMPARPIIVNEAGVILGGNMRYRACLENGMTEVPASWVQRVEGWPLEKQKRFIILDNRGFGEDDMDALANEWEVEDLIAAGFTEEELTGEEFNSDGEKGQVDSPYTNKIVAPIYEPKGECPPVKDLFDRDKTARLIAEIDAAGLPDEIAHFMRLAAERHTVFNFRQIAEFYCHADAKLQDLMERSGLVIIDFKKAIEYGFVHLTERLGEIADLEEADNGDA